jgi:hypothetical protein
MRSTSLLPVIALLLAPTFALGCGKKTEPEKGSSSEKSDKSDKKKDDDKSDKKDGDKGEKKKKPKGADDTADKGDDKGDDKPKAAAGSGCKAPEAELKGDFTITKGCKLKLESYVAINDGAVLTIEPGATISFGPDSYIEVVYGRIVAKGTDDDPIVFTSSNKDPAAGDWPGLFIADKAMSGNVFDKVTIEYAGRDAHGGHGAVTLEGAVHGGRVAITNTKFKNSKTTGVWGDNDDAAFAKFEGNSFVKMGDSAIDVPSMVLGSVGKNDWGGHVIRSGGDVTASITWPKVDVPIVINRAIAVRGVKDAAIFTLADKSVLKFGPEAYIEVGLENGSGVVAKGCTFTSANATAAVGDWPGLFFGEKTTGTTIDGGSVEYAGRDAHGSHAAMTYLGTAKKIANAKVTGVAFKKNLNSAFFSDDADCGPNAEKASGNTADGPLCNKKE